MSLCIKCLQACTLPAEELDDNERQSCIGRLQYMCVITGDVPDTARGFHMDCVRVINESLTRAMLADRERRKNTVQ